MLSDLELTVSFPIDDMTLEVQIYRLNVGKVSVLSSTFGHLSGATIKLEINNGWRVA